MANVKLLMVNNCLSQFLNILQFVPVRPYKIDPVFHFFLSFFFNIFILYFSLIPLALLIP